MTERARELPDGKRFDAVIVDEAQDFADHWWQTLMAALRDTESAGLCVYSDENQRIFARFGPLAPLRMQLRGVELLLDAGWRPEHIARPTMGSRHPI